MAIDWLTVDEESSNEVPWLKDFIDAGGDYDTPVDVVCCFIGTKGILVLTDSYKGFVFKGSRLHEELIEALQSYPIVDTGLPVLVACGNSSGKIQLGLDQLRLEAQWKKDKTIYRQHVLTNDELANARSKKSNRLIPPTIPSAKKKAQTKTDATA